MKQLLGEYLITSPHLESLEQFVCVRTAGREYGIMRGDVMRVYLDNCCYNRPFDPQTDLRVCIETMAKMRVQALMKDGSVEYAWSDALDYELGQSPNYQEPDMIAPWRDGAAVDVAADAALIERAEEIQSYGIKAMDALHIASAESAGCDWFLTTDRGILKKLRRLGGMQLANPIDFITEDER